MTRQPDPQPPLLPPAEVYPPYVRDAEDRRRWDLCSAIAELLMQDPTGSPAHEIWMTTRSLYQSPIPTGGLRVQT